VCVDCFVEEVRRRTGGRLNSVDVLMLENPTPAMVTPSVLLLLCNYKYDI